MALMCGLVDYKWRHLGDFRIFVFNKRNWQNTSCCVSNLDPQFFAKISASRWKFKNRLDDATSTTLHRVWDHHSTNLGLWATPSQPKNGQKCLPKHPDG